MTDRCLIHHDGQLWAAQDRSVHAIEHGAYIRVRVPPPFDEHLDTEAAIAISRDFALPAHQGTPSDGSCLPAADDRSSLFQLTTCAVPALKARLAPGHEVQPHLPGEHGNSGPPVPQGRERTSRFAPGDFERFQRLFNAESCVECEDEGHVAYIDTWFIHHVHHRVCPELRAVRLHDDPSSWLADIIQTWDPLLMPEEDVVVRLVRPQPPCTRFQCVWHI